MASSFNFIIMICCSLLSAMASSNPLSETYIVHMGPRSVPKPFISPHTYYSSLLTSNSIIYTYTNSIHGFSAKLSPEEHKSIKNTPGYLSSTKDVRLRLMTTHSSDFLGLNSLSGAWPASDFGQDVIIGDVDTGIWLESQSFSDEGITEIPEKWKGGCYGGTNFNTSKCNRKLIGVRYFNKGFKANNGRYITFLDSARDFSGHGTHVSSTAAGNYIQGVSYFGYASGTAKGTAPRARLAMYKAGFTKLDDIYSSDVIAAIDSAIMDGVDILSISIGNLGPLYEDPISIATFTAMSKGVFVSNAAGNFGPSPGTIFTGAPWDLIIGASTINRELQGTITLSNGVQIRGSSFYTLHPIRARLPVVHTNSCGSGGQFKALGKIILCHVDDDINGNSTSSIVKALRDTKVAGAIIIVNSSSSDLPSDEIGFPAIFVNAANGKIILDYVNSSYLPTATLRFNETCHNCKQAPKVAYYSARGPSLSYPLILKPDLMGPGDSILASWQDRTPVNLGVSENRTSNFSMASGTSMAAPHAAGVAALLKRVHPDWTPAAIRSAMMTTANVLDNFMNPIQELGLNRAATPLAMGAGHINPCNALDPGLVYDVHRDDYVNFLCALNLTANQIHAIVRSPYSCLNSSLDLNYPSFVAYFDSGNRTNSAEFHRTLTNVGDGNSSYSVKLGATMEGVRLNVVPDTLVFKYKYDKQSYRVKIEGPSLRQGSVVDSSISWVEIGGHHIVRSPVVVLCRD